MKRLFTVLYTFVFLSALSQNNPTDSIISSTKEELRSFKSKREIEIMQMVQLWNVTSLENSGNTPNQSRNDLFIRRGRIGVRGMLRTDLSFWVLCAYDGIGRDKYTAGNGNPNDPDNRDFYIWDAYWTYSPHSMLNITAGYFRPQVGRESFSSAGHVISFEKTLPNFHPRIHMLGRSTGREAGLNLGGLYKGKGWSFNYILGWFETSNANIVGTGSRWAPLLTSRFSFTIGAPEIDKYKIVFPQSYQGNRKGITFAVNGTYQAETEIFRENGLYGADILANYKRFDFVAEYDWMYRNSINDTINFEKATMDHVYSVKLGYSIPLKKSRALQFVVAYSALEAQDYGSKAHYNKLTTASDQHSIDIGLNYLLNNDKIKLSLHYISGQREDKTSDPNFSYVGSGFQYQF